MYTEQPNMLCVVFNRYSVVGPYGRGRVRARFERVAMKAVLESFIDEYLVELGI